MACNVLHVRKIKAGRFLKNEVIFQPIFQLCASVGGHSQFGWCS